MDLPDLYELQDDELARLIEELEQEEHSISYRRRLLQGRLDLLRFERDQRSRGAHVGIEQLAETLSGSTARPPRRSQKADESIASDAETEAASETLEAFPVLETLSDNDLERLIADLEHQEQAISKRRRVHHARIDLLRTERVVRMRRERAAGVTDG